MSKKWQSAKWQSAFGYIRMSTDRQEKSPAQQKEEIRKYARLHGYAVVKWFVDEGITGDSIQQRPQFAEMLEACQTGDVKAILAWDMSRFGRFNPFEGGTVIAPLMKAGVRLCTVVEGAIDWNSFSGQVLSTIQMAANHDFLRKLSANVVRGILARPPGSYIPIVPLGMVRVFFDPSGAEKARAEWDEKFQKPPGWSVGMDVSANSAREHEREAMRWAFYEFAKGTASLADIAIGLEQRGIVAKDGRRHYRSTVRSLLANPKYVGRIESGTQPGGKYFRAAEDGSIVPVSGNPQQFHAPHRKRSPISIVKVCDGLIPEAVFNEVQERIADLPKYPHSKLWLGILSGILRCAACQTRMHHRYVRSANAPGGRFSYYACSGNERGIGFGGQENGCFTVRAEPLEDYALRVVGALVMLPDAAAQIEEAIRRKLADAPSTHGGQERRLLAEIEREIEVGQTNLLRVEGEDLEALKRKLGGHRIRRDELRARVREIGRVPISTGAIEKRALSQVEDIGHALATGDRKILRLLLRSLFRSITIQMRSVGGKSSVFGGGVAILNLERGPLAELGIAERLETLRQIPVLSTAEIVDLTEDQLLPGCSR